jgi:hypothetical protein
MNSRLVLSCTAAAAAITIGWNVSAQAPPPPPGAVLPAPPAGPAAPVGTYSAYQSPETRGTVQHFTLTPMGEIDGVILADGTEVHVPPHLTAEMASAVRIGDTVSVQGYRSPSAPVVAATSITDTNTRQTVVDNGPPPPGSRPPPPGVPAVGAQQATVQAKVQRSLYGPAGDVNGALLEDGTIVRLPPPTAYQVASLLNPGQVLAVQGWELTTAYGRVIDAQAVGASSGQLTQVAPPPGYAFAPAAPPAPPR